MSDDDRGCETASNLFVPSNEVANEVARVEPNAEKKVSRVVYVVFYQNSPFIHALLLFSRSSHRSSYCYLN